MGPKRFLRAHALFVGVVVLIAVVWVGGRSMLGWHEGHVASEVPRGEHSVVRSAAPGLQGPPPVEGLPGASRPAASGGVWVHGRVGDARSGYAGTLVFRAAQDEEARQTHSQPDGFYELLLARPGPYAITFEPSERSGLPERLLLSTSIDADDELELALALPGGALQGRLSTTAGTPVAGAPVALYRGALVEGAPTGEPCAATTSDAEGRFAFRLLERGVYHVFARSEEGTRFARAEVELASEDEATPLELRWPD